MTDDLERFSRAWDAFFRATRRRRARHEAVDDGPLTIPQYQLLEPLLAGAALSVRDLAEQAGVAPPTATRMLDGLERSGFVTRSSSPRDRRVVDVALSPEGDRIVRERSEQVDAWRRRLYESLPPADREQAARLLQRLSEGVESL